MDCLQGVIHFFGTYYLNPYWAFQANLEFNPFAKYNKKNKKFLRSIGIGFKYSSKSFEEEVMNMRVEEDLSEYEFDKISEANIK